jgi:hypothetical protein
MIGPALVVAFSALGLFVGTFPDFFWHRQYTSHDKKLDVLALPLTCIIGNLQKPRTLIYRKRAESPSNSQIESGQLALNKWLPASAAERHLLVDDIIASGVVIGMPSSKVTELLGQAHYTEPTIVSPHTYVYMMDEQTELCVSTDKEGQVRGAELVIEFKKARNSLEKGLLPSD